MRREKAVTNLDVIRDRQIRRPIKKKTHNKGQLGMNGTLWLAETRPGIYNS